MSETTGASAPGGHARGLSTARAVLQVLAYLSEHPAGVRADEVAGVVGKSVSTAYYLLASLCEEGFAHHEPHGGLYTLARPIEPAPLEARDDGHELSDSVELLFRRTGKRSYLGVVRAPSGVEIAAVCGRQGVPRMPGLGTRITSNAHALAMGKVVLALMPDDGRRRYVERGLQSFTPNTITAPEVLERELEEVRATGYAVDREEFDADFCCVAAPVLGDDGEPRGVLGLSSTVRSFDTQREVLVEAVRETARTALS